MLLLIIEIYLSVLYSLSTLFILWLAIRFIRIIVMEYKQGVKDEK